VTSRQLSQSQQVAVGSGLLGLLGVAATALEFQHASAVIAAGSGDLPGGFAAFFAFTFLGTTVLALTAAVTLGALATWATPGPSARRLLCSGVTLTGLSTVPMAVHAVGHSLSDTPPVELLGAWWLSAFLGAFVTGVGLVAHVVGPLDHAAGRSIEVATAVVALAVAANGVAELDGSALLFGAWGVGLLLGGVALFAVCLAVVLRVLDPLAADYGRVLGYAGLFGGFVGAAAATVVFATDGLFPATVVGASALLALWAVWARFGPVIGEPGPATSPGETA
jgi:hypothetical protein